MFINNGLFLSLDFCISFSLVTKWKNKFCKQLLKKDILFGKDIQISKEIIFIINIYIIVKKQETNVVILIYVYNFNELKNL